MPLDDNHPHYSLLKLHHERGAAPHDLIRAGYIEYDTVVDGIPTTLWRRPGTQRCTRGAHLEPEPDQPQPGPTRSTAST